ncbi:MAG: aminotransferase class IV, partial [Proteobacteria bacterium]|nr:aminotransferase class IV [Pseudomonadota bacterium]
MKNSDTPNIYASGCAFARGQFVPMAEATIPLADWGFIKSDVTYDVVGVWDGAFFRLDDHLERFHASMRHMRLVCPHDATDIRRIIEQCVARTGLRRAYVSMMTTRGVNPKGTRDPRDCINAFYAYVVPYIWIVPPERLDAGIDIRVTDIQRIPPGSIDPRAKNFHWGDLIQALFQAYETDAETALTLDAQGDVSEGPGFNVFAFSSGTWITPGTGVLEGVTRKTAMELITVAGDHVVAGALSRSALSSADEVFLTSTAGGIMPVRSVDGRKIGAGRPGPRTLAL